MLFEITGLLLAALIQGVMISFYQSAEPCADDGLNAPKNHAMYAYNQTIYMKNSTVENVMTTNQAKLV